MLHEVMDDPKDWVSRTKQSFRAEVDINQIIARARQGQAVTHVARNLPSYMDVSEVGDYKSALDMLRSTDAFFAKLPAKVRFAFDNDPALFLDSMDTVEGRARLEAAGLVEPLPATVPVRGHAHERGFEARVTRNADGTFAKEGPDGSPSDPKHT